MWKYNQTDELYHFGIPGMKWGQHRMQRLKDRQQSMLSKNNLNKKYIKTSNKIYLHEQKQKLKDAKKRKDIVDTIHMKNRIKEFKFTKNDTSDMNGNMFKSVYKVKKGTKQGEAINTITWQSQYGKQKAKNVLRAAGSIGVSALATSPIWYPKAKEGIKYLKNNKIIKISYDLGSGSLNVLGRERQ